MFLINHFPYDEKLAVKVKMTVNIKGLTINKYENKIKIFIYIVLAVGNRNIHLVKILASIYRTVPLLRFIISNKDLSVITKLSKCDTIGFLNKINL